MLNAKLMGQAPQGVGNELLLLQVMSWGGYSFIINLVPIHCLACIFTGRLNSRLYVAFAPFIILGTIEAGAPSATSTTILNPKAYTEFKRAMSPFGLRQTCGGTLLITGGSQPCIGG